ncbi:Vacuolar sorting-associated 66 [Hyphodiscus hymeniophilus]|uniref:Vacuolar sorting-associated 66 n=1 Tax=Hyphodiscus hymeniophilus TaxID=353542 RepID=A0A9P7AVD7_9HELO|nr:Vacuolar sorting-associated 66 [Hyphodiscus hymeniophilus]
MEVGGRVPYADFGLVPGPTLLEKLPLDVLRDDREGVRVCEDTEDENEVFRAAPMRDVAFTADLAVGGAGIVLGSPALSASVLRCLGSGIAPFFPVSSEPAGLYLPVCIFLFLFKLPFFITVSVTYFLFLQWFPLGSLVKKAILWMILGIPGIWWIVLQIDGVKKGSLAKKHEGRVPQPPDVIASSFTSPIDSLYLAAIFDPIFTVSYPHTRQVQHISLLGAIFRALSKPQEYPPKGAKMIDLRTLIAEHPKRCIVVFPECTTTNGRGILPFSPSLLTAPPGTKIFPVSLRYSPPDITTPVPGAYWSFLWNLLSQPTHCIRVRIAEVVYNTSTPDAAVEMKDKYLTNVLDQLAEDSAMMSSTDTLTSLSDQSGEVNTEEKRILDKVGEALARLGRVKRVGLSVKDKMTFVDAWSKRRR